MSLPLPFGGFNVSPRGDIRRKIRESISRPRAENTFAPDDDATSFLSRATRRIAASSWIERQLLRARAKFRIYAPAELFLSPQRQVGEVCRACSARDTLYMRFTNGDATRGSLSCYVRETTRIPLKKKKKERHERKKRENDDDEKKRGRKEREKKKERQRKRGELRRRSRYSPYGLYFAVHPAAMRPACSMQISTGGR